MTEIARVISNAEIKIGEDGAVSQQAIEAIPKDKLDEVLAKLEDPNCSAAEVSRMIAIELAKIARDAVRIDIQDAWKQKLYETQVKVLQALSKQLSDTEVLSKKDNLNFDGPKFRWVLAELTSIFKKTLEDVKLEVSMVNNIMLQFADSMSEKEPYIRRESEKVTDFKVSEKTR